ncbi:YciI family protein [Actinomycetospora sp.]|uniref:YciI family protein n=1 Tax=Actinomycetospora sp. TaxID=1872135 RepID=UPI002F413993
MKFLLLTRHNASEADIRPMAEWDPADAEAHLAALRAINEQLTESGELLVMQALADPAAGRIVHGLDAGTPIVTDGPYPESTELLAGYQLVDVVDEDRALEIAAQVAAAPGPGGKPINNRIEVRAVMFSWA